MSRGRLDARDDDDTKVWDRRWRRRWRITDDAWVVVSRWRDI